jgi:hypothetical protein
MVFGPLVGTAAWWRARVPKSGKKWRPSANFITLHCEYKVTEHTGLG